MEERMMRKVLAVAVGTVFVALALSSAAADLPADPMPLPLAREVIGQTIALVDSKGVYPRDRMEYEQAKAQLMLLLSNAPEQVDRAQVHDRIRKLLATLDADGHSLLFAPVQQKQMQTANTANNKRLPSAFQLVSTSQGTVLRWTPPPNINGPDVINVNVKRFYDEADAHPEIKGACALVVDLSEQTGGHAWPPLVAMYPLFGVANTAKLVDRDGKRTPVVNLAQLEELSRQGAAGRANPLTPYVAGPLAVVVGKRTASAGEMLLVALLGESRVQTFGQTSYGLSTANQTYPLADGSQLVLTEMRYAQGEQPAYRGGIPVMHPSEQGAPVDSAVKAAAEWAAAHSAACVATPGLAPEKT
jgi:hypothetical protein